MSRVLMVIGAILFAPILLVPVVIVAIAAGPVLATVLLAAACWLVLFAFLNVFRAVGLVIRHMSGHSANGHPVGLAS